MGINITSYLTGSRFAREVRRLGKWGQHLADFLGKSNREIGYPGFGNGTGYTVANWIADGYFANLSEVQTFYPICQGTSDTVDWVLLQSAIDDTIYGALGSSNYGMTKRILHISAGRYLCNRTLNVGHGRAGTPPSNLNGNGYITITIKGEGAQVDPSGNGMTGVTIDFTSQVGIAVTLPQDVQIEDITIRGPHLSWLVNNNTAARNSASPGDLSLWKPTGIADANFIGGAAVSIGIGTDIYSASASAAAYDARPLPEYFGGGTTTALTGAGNSGTGLFLKNVNISGFIIGWGHPHGDGNGEFLRQDGGNLTFVVYGFVSGHSQARNNSLRNINVYCFHTAISATGGTRSNANHHGCYTNIHAGYGYQLFNHSNADWSGVFTVRDSYMEGFSRIGNWNGKVRLDGCYLSFYEQTEDRGVPPSHYDIDHLILDGCDLVGLQHGLVSATKNDQRIEIINGTNIRISDHPNWENVTDAAKVRSGAQYMGQLLHFPGWNVRRFTSDPAKSRFGLNDDSSVGGYPDALGSMTYFDQESVDFNAVHPFTYGKSGTVSGEMMGPTHRFAVPKMSQYQKRIDFISRSGLDIVCDRVSFGNIKMDVGDYLFAKPDGATESFRLVTWFVVVSVTTSTMTIRQQSNYFGTSQYDYQTNGNYQFNPTTGEGVSGGSAPGYGLFTIICTRIKQHRCLWVGDVTSGSNVITNVKNALAYGSVDDFVTGNFYAAVGDFHLHHEIERANTGGAGLTLQNKITAIDFSANTITMTSNFNITRANYPLPFFVKVFNA